MASLQVLEGTIEEITIRLNEVYDHHQRVRITVESEEWDLSDAVPPPPNRVRDRAHLAELLLEGTTSLNSSHGIPVTSDTWILARAELESQLKDSLK